MYKSIYSLAQASFTEQKSEFIAKISPVKTEEDAVSFIESVKAENRKARHNCYAYVLSGGNLSRYSDDGEPSGTAGPPILDVIQKNGLSDVAIVVTRYFGGILLGKGGLTRAYSTAASMAVSAARIMELEPAKALTVTMHYSCYDRVCCCLPEFDARMTSTDFSDKVKISITVRADKTDALLQKLNDITSGSAVIDISDEFLYDFAQ